MRFEQIITAVTRPVVTATVREIKAVVTFANALRLHQWLQRMPLGMSTYLGSMPASPLGGDGGWTCQHGFDSKRGHLQAQPLLVPASCPSRIRRG